MKIRNGSVGNRSRNYFEIMTNGDVLNYSDNAFPGTIIMGNLITDSVEGVVASPVLRGDSPKFNEWFQLMGSIPGAETK